MFASSPPRPAPRDAERAPYPPHVEAVLFDYGGVVHPEGRDDFDAADRRADLPPGRLWSAYHAIPEHGRSRRGEIDPPAYLAAVEADLRRDLGASAARSLVDDFERRRAALPPVAPEMAELVVRVRKRVRVGLVTNGLRGTTATLASLGVADLFDVVLASGDVGFAKPDPALFRLAAARLTVGLEACAFVDDIERHVVAAAALGMSAHLYVRAQHDRLVDFLTRLGVLAPPPP